jgi:hypothetical protein
MNLIINMDATALEGKLARWAAVREPFLVDATSKSLDVVQNTAVNYMYAKFKNPQGPLEEDYWTQTITPQTDGVEGKLENSAPYAWRREKGFSNQTDALGRYFSDDPGIGYMKFALRKSKPSIRPLFSDALAASVAAL